MKAANDLVSDVTISALGRLVKEWPEAEKDTFKTQELSRSSPDWSSSSFW